MRIVGCKVNGKKGKREKKRRTREHILADLSVNFVERFVLLGGHSTERIQNDYGIDLLMFTYGDNGEIENGHVQLQLKATDHIKKLKNSDYIAFSVQMADVTAWQWEPLPVILVIYDAEAGGQAYWLYVQNYVNNPENLGRLAEAASDEQDTITFHVPVENQINSAAIERFRNYRERILAQVKGIIEHDT